MIETNAFEYILRILFFPAKLAHEVGGWHAVAGEGISEALRKYARLCQNIASFSFCNINRNWRVSPLFKKRITWRVSFVARSSSDGSKRIQA